MKRHGKALFAVAVAMLLLGAGVATALQTREQSEEIDASATPNGAFGSLDGLAVDRTGGDLYVTDRSGAGTPVEGTGAVHRFDSSGAYEATIDGSATPQGAFAFDDPSDVAIDNSGSASDGTVYVTDILNGFVNGFDETGAVESAFSEDGQLDGSQTPAGAFSFPCSLVVDSEARLLVGDYGNNQIWIFDSEGTYLDNVEDPQLASPCGLAFDSSGDLYVRNYGDGRVLEFDRAGPTDYDLLATVYDPANGTPEDPEDDGPLATDVAVDPADDHLYVDKGSRITEYDSSGAEILSFGQGLLTGSRGIAVQDAGRIYASDGEVLRVFGAPTQVAAAIEKAWASEVGASAATLNARIDPAGEEGTYRFEYVTEAEFQANGFANASKAPEPDGQIGPEPVEVARTLNYLEPATSYRFRVIATNLAGPTEGAAQSFTTFPLPGEFALPDERAYEMVSPLAKNGGEVMGETSRTWAAAQGDAVAFTSLSGFPGTLGAGLTFQYMSVRTPSGWATHSLMPPQQPQDASTVTSVNVPTYVGDFSADLGKGVFRALTPLTDAPNVAQTRNLYVREDARTPGLGSYRLASDSELPVPPNGISPNIKGYQPKIAATSADFSHVLFESRLNLTAEASGSVTKLYESVEGVTRLAGVLPNGEPASCSSGATCSAAGRSSTRLRYTHGTISRDGRRVFFTSPVTNAGSETPESQLYMRSDGTETVRINASEKESPDPTLNAEFWGTSGDGSKAFFTSPEDLTDDPGSANLYQYDAGLPDSADNLTPIASSVAGVIGAGENGEYLYFVGAAGQQLVPGEPEVPGCCFGIYLAHEGQIRYIGHMTGTDNDVFGQGAYTLGQKTSRVSDDGRVLAFLAGDGDGLGGLDHGSCVIDSFDQPCRQAYFYDAAANGGEGELTCASCPPSGAPATARATFWWEIGTAGTVTNYHKNRVLTPDGRRLFFTSAERLVAEDRNGAVQDVYEYDVEAKTVHLLTQGSEDSFFMEASASGDDVFFLTRNRLVGKDTDNAFDLYDARVGGGFPEAPPQAVCEGDACLVAPSAPEDPTPASLSFRGPGDAKPRKARKRCAKGKRRVKARGGKARCVKRKADRRKRANTNRRAGR